MHLGKNDIRILTAQSMESSSLYLHIYADAANPDHAMVRGSSGVDSGIFLEDKHEFVSLKVEEHLGNELLSWIIASTSAGRNIQNWIESWYVRTISKRVRDKYAIDVNTPSQAPTRGSDFYGSIGPSQMA